MSVLSANLPEAQAATIEQRTHPRLPCSEAVTLRLESGQVLEGNLRDVSRTGAGVLIPEPLTPGTRIHLTCGGVVFDGEVRHCTAQGLSYFAGILV